MKTGFFGLCPRTGTVDGYLNIGRQHWFYSDEGCTRWLAGENLFGSWRDEDDAVWLANAERLAVYEVVEPYCPSRLASDAPVTLGEDLPAG